MSDHHHLRLRAITVSTRAALASHLSSGEEAAVRGRAEDLLADLQTDVLANGADAELLDRITEARRTVRAAAAPSAQQGPGTKH